MRSEAEYFAFIGDSAPIRSHSQCVRVGTRKANENNAVPSVPGVPTVKCCVDAGVIPVPGHLRDPWEERAAIMEFDGEMSRGSAEQAALADVIELNAHRAKTKAAR